MCSANAGLLLGKYYLSLEVRLVQGWLWAGTYASGNAEVSGSDNGSDCANVSALFVLGYCLVNTIEAKM